MEGDGMGDGIAYQNKDILFKVLSGCYPHVSFKAYGLDLPAVREVLPTDLPGISASGLRADGVFLLEDGSLLIMEYESSPDAGSLLKYGHYAFRVLERHMRAGGRIPRVVIAVVYTSDVASAPALLDAGGLRIEARQCFLRDIDGDAAALAAKAKVEGGLPLSDEEALRLIVAPLARSKRPRQEMIEGCVEIAKGIADGRLQAFVIAGLLVATDKFVDRGYSNSVRRWIGMTKVGQIIQEEIEAAAAAAAAAATAAAAETAAAAAAEAAAEAAAKAAAEKNRMAKILLRDGVEPSAVVRYTGLTKGEIERLLLS
jgi:hypothetical protein